MNKAVEDKLSNIVDARRSMQIPVLEQSDEGTVKFQVADCVVGEMEDRVQREMGWTSKPECDGSAVTAR